MRIVGSRLERIGGGRCPPVTRDGVETRRGWLLTLIADDGREGWGEASPLPDYSPESFDDAGAALDGIHRSLAGLHLDREPVAAVVRSLSPARAPLEAAPSALFAVETALFDLLGQAHRVPMHRLLAAAAPASSLPRSALLSSPLDPRRSLEEAGAALARGVGAIKAKVGSNLDAELAVLGSLREALPPFALRLDANGCWNAAEAREALARIATLSPEWVEEPCAGEALVSLGLPCAADESLATHAAALIAAPHVRAVVVKPARLGLLRARRIALDALARGKQAVVTHLFDGPVALAAGCELALALPSRTPHGLDPHPALAAFAPAVVPQLAGPADIRAIPRPGLGLRSAEGEERAWKH